jgi:hypothetical protein
LFQLFRLERRRAVPVKLRSHGCELGSPLGVDRIERKLGALGGKRFERGAGIYELAFAVQD